MKCTFFLSLFLLLASCRVNVPTAMLGSARSKSFEIAAGNIQVPHERTLLWNDNSEFADSVIKEWSDMPMADWENDGKTTAPRILLARLYAKKDIPETNKVIQSLVPRGVTGSKWWLNPKGDYDFTLTTLTTILFLFGEKPDILYPETKDHLVNVLLTDSGDKFRKHVPHTLGLIIDTENHILMTEGSRYLKNQWLTLHGNTSKKFNNEQNGMELRLHSFLSGLTTMGLFEFNSLPYIGYTIAALLNLEAFGSEQIRTDARNVLDYMNWCYALGSLELNHFPPMRRRYEKAGIRDFASNYHTAFMTTWLHFLNDTLPLPTRELVHAHTLVASYMPYRPADDVVKWQFDKGNGYFVQFGHGPGATPEIYTAGKNYLLSAGGSNRGESSHIVSRPICLFLKDGANAVAETVHLYGPTKDYMKWNNTGVFQNLAVAAGPVHVPEHFHPVVVQGNWAAYALQDSITLVVYSCEDFGLFLVEENMETKTYFESLMKLNPDELKLRSSFVTLNQRVIQYNVHAPHRLWVIQSENGIELNRKVDTWPLMNGVFR
jgi:hypothetical protein